ncbi:MAG: FAD-dependent oxidoreductase [Mycobacterium sp.]
MSSPGTLVVGAGQAGVQLALSLREAGYDKPITLVGDEPHLPYQRPPLSKAYLKGDVAEGSILLRAPKVLDDKRIEVIVGERVEHLALDGDGPSGVAHTVGGRALAFERLALAVGAEARRLSVQGCDLGGVHYLRNLGEAHRLRGDLLDAQSVVVVGGGFIGLEAAAVLRGLGKSVTVVEMSDRLIGRAVAPAVSEFYAAAHRRRGVELRFGAQVVAVDGQQGRVIGVQLDDNSCLTADLVVVGIGVVPDTSLAEQLSLRCLAGVVVDSYARTSNPDIVAAGDCTVQPHPLGGAGQVRLESVQNAVSQAKTAAGALLGVLGRIDPVPWFWSDQFDLKLQIAGLSLGYDTAVVRGDPAAESFSVVYYRDSRLLAVDAVNAGADYMAVRKALTIGATIPPEVAADGSAALRDHIVAVA